MNRKVLLIGVGVLAIAVVAWTLLLWRPAGTELDEAREVQIAAEDDQALQQSQFARLKAIETDVPRLQSGIETLRSAVPDDASLAEFLLALDEAGAASGVKVSSVSSQEPALDLLTGLHIVRVSVAASGGYYQVLDFLNRVQEMHRIMSVSSVAATANRGDDPFAAPSMELVIGAEIFSTGLDAQAAAVLDAASAAAVQDAGAETNAAKTYAAGTGSEGQGGSS